MRTTLIALCAVMLLPGPLPAQSLGQIAADEAARRKAIQKPARVLTADDVKPADPVTTPTEAPPFPSDVAAASGGDPTAPRVLVAPAKLAGGGMPMIPVMAVNGGEVYLEVDVSAEGRVTGAKVLRTTPPFTEAMTSAVGGWRFQPAEDAVAPPSGGTPDDQTRRKVASKVLVLGLFRPPSVFQGMAPGTPPANVAAASESVAAPTGSFTMPPYPPQALFNGVVLVELGVKADGSVSGAKVLRGAAPFDQLAVQAAASLGFRAPRVHGRPAPANVYVAVAFRQPVTP